MTEPPETPAPAPKTTNAVTSRTPEQIAKAARTTRLAKALRDNLRRRKAMQPKRDRPGN